MTTDQSAQGNPPAPDDPPAPGNPPAPGPQARPSRTQVAAAALLFLAVFAGGVFIGVFVLSSNDTGAPNNALACSYFWQFEAAPNIPALVQIAMNRNPGTDSGSHFLGEWLYTLEQQVSSARTSPAELQSDSQNATALGVSSICQQLGFNSPGS
jgi:hypothetical protein